MTVAGHRRRPAGRGRRTVTARPARRRSPSTATPTCPSAWTCASWSCCSSPRRVKVAPDHAWELVEPRLRRRCWRRLGYAGRELGQPARLSDASGRGPDRARRRLRRRRRLHRRPGLRHPGRARRAGSPTPGAPRSSVPAHEADVRREDPHASRDADGETLTGGRARHGITLAELLRLNPDITDTRRLAKGRVGVRLPRHPPRPARPAVPASPGHADPDGGHVMAAHRGCPVDPTASREPGTRRPRRPAAPLAPPPRRRGGRAAARAARGHRRAGSTGSATASSSATTTGSWRRAADWVLPYLGDLVGYRTAARLRAGPRHGPARRRAGACARCRGRRAAPRTSPPPSPTAAARAPCACWRSSPTRSRAGPRGPSSFRGCSLTTSR